MEISITQEDIDNGTPASITHCAFALAIKRAFGRHEVFVYQDYCMVVGKRYEIPGVAKTNLFLYDLENKLEPFTFNLVST
jgi:hypothetical protein